MSLAELQCCDILNDHFVQYLFTNAQNHVSKAAYPLRYQLIPINTIFSSSWPMVSPVLGKSIVGSKVSFIGT